MSGEREFGMTGEHERDGRRARQIGLVMLATLMLLPMRAYAQGSAGGSIAGVVKDTTGGALPGVTVEAASPALIEKVRTVTSDNEGQYKIVDLRPGVYTVTFTLTGFNALKRDGIEVVSGATVAINADLRVGSLQETVTVSGQAPTVDVQNVTQERVNTRDIINAIPTGQRSIQNLGAMIPGIVNNTQDVGGTSLNNGTMMIHGGRGPEMQLLVDGLYANNGQSRGGPYMSSRPSDGATQEVQIVTDNINAESDLGSVITNIIPKDGGNTFSGALSGSYAPTRWEGNNLDSALQAQGLTASSRVASLWEILPAFGGPIVKDKMWFYTGIREFRMNLTVAGLYKNVTPQSLTYTPDPTHTPVIDDTFDGIYGERITTQVTPKNKVALYYSMQREIRNQYYSQGAARALISPEAMWGYNAIPDYLGYVTWTSPVTNRLLLESGAAFTNKDWYTTSQPETPFTNHPIQDLATGYTWGNYPFPVGHQDSHQFNTRFVASYITGSHAIKVGEIFQNAGSYVTQVETGNGVVLQVFNGVPRQVVTYATPLHWVEIQKAMLGTFAEDTWTIKRMTLNLGLRYDWFNSYVPSLVEGPGPNVPNRNITFPEVDNVPNWKNWSPRLGASWDLFGNGKTALKVSLGKYLEGPALNIYTRLADPAASIAVSATRSWTDTNGNGLPDCDLGTAAANGECGPNNNVNFGNSIVTTRYASDVPTTRITSWEFSTAIQHELFPRTSLNVGYYRRWYNNLLVTQNVAVSSADYSPYCIPVPVDPRLPGGGGGQECGFYDVSPAKFGQVNNYVSEASHFGSPADVYDGADASLAARLPHGILAMGGVSVGRERTNDCFQLNDLSLLFPSALSVPGGAANTSVLAPHTTAFCDVRPPFQPNVKLFGVFPLPIWNLQTSATFQSLPGPMITAQAAIPNSAIAPSLGRNLAAGANGTATVDLIAPGTLYGARLYQTDFRMTKKFSAGRTKLMANLDFFNLFNANPPINLITTYGPAWQRPAPILLGRVIKIGGQLEF
jgi:hypothetical protein